MQSFIFLIRNTLWVVSAMLTVVILILLISLAMSLERWRTGDLLTEPVPVELTERDTH